MAETIRIEGGNKVIRAFREVDGDLARKFGNDLKKAADPVVEATKQKEGRWRGASIRTIRSRRRGFNIYVEQSARKVTGLRGDFGQLQMRDALVPALEENTTKVAREVESVLDQYAEAAGF